MLLSTLAVFQIPIVKATGTEQIINGSFESGSGTSATGWTNAYRRSDFPNGHTGTYWDSVLTNSYGTLYQSINFSVPVSTITSSGFYYNSGYGSGNYMNVTILYSDGSTTTTSDVIGSDSNIWYYLNLMSYFSTGKIVVNLRINAYIGNMPIDDVSLIGISSTVTVAIGAPLSGGIYTTSYIHVSLNVTTTTPSATIDKIWYNCLNGSSWIFANNQTYTIQTNMTGFINGNYNFYAWANDTSGFLGYNNATFLINNVVTVTIGAPLSSGIYTTSYIHVSLSATTNGSATIDKIWYNCLNGSSWIYANNLTYTIQTSMNGFVYGNYNFYAWANDTSGNIGYKNATFTITNVFLQRIAQSLSFNFQQPIALNNQPFYIYNDNYTFSNMTTWNWVQLPISYGDSSYAFRFDTWINFTVSLYSEIAYFQFTTSSNDSYTANHRFGFYVVASVSGISCWTISTEPSGIQTGNTINTLNNEFLQYTLLFLYNATINTYYEQLDIYQGLVVNPQIFRSSLGTSYLARENVSSIQQNNQLNFNVYIAGLGIPPQYHWLTLWSYIPYQIQFSPNYVSFDGFKFTLDPSVTYYSVDMVFLIKQPNFTSPLQQLYYINGTYWLWTTATTPPFTYYNTANPDDDTIGVRIANGSTFVLRYTGNNGFIYEQISFSIAQNPSDCYEGLKIGLAFYQDVGDFPNFTYSNVAYKVGQFNFILKYFHVPPMPEPVMIVTSFSFINILILLVVPMMICIMLFWKRIKFYSVVFGAVVDFAIGFLTQINGSPLLPLWVLFFIGGGIVFFFYLKISHKTEGRV